MLPCAAFQFPTHSLPLLACARRCRTIKCLTLRGRTIQTLLCLPIVTTIVSTGKHGSRVIGPDTMDCFCQQYTFEGGSKKKRCAGGMYSFKSATQPQQPLAPIAMVFKKCQTSFVLSRRFLAVAFGALDRLHARGHCLMTVSSKDNRRLQRR